MVKSARRILLILGDQLSMSLPSLKAADPDTDVILMAEVRSEATYVRHHKKKIAFIFSAMRHHAEALKSEGWIVDYRKYNARNNAGSLTGELELALKRHKATGVLATRARERRVVCEQEAWAEALNVPVTLFEDDAFLCSSDEFADWAKGRKSLRMEYFYRDMRRKTGLLMEGEKPIGGQWNFDKENRKPASRDLLMPSCQRVEPDGMTKEVIELVNTVFADHFGTLESFWFGVTREHALAVLDDFLQNRLAQFGDYQDAMLTDEPFLYHSLLSFYMNVGLLNPMEVCQGAEISWKSGKTPINAVEGFIRQIIGWREYVNGIYWYYNEEKFGPYTAQNFLQADRSLPEFYWTADTNMACLRAAIEQTRDEAYAHHIQRLMVTGLFAMLIGAKPYEVHEWYLAVYADAFEWVEAPNTIGMSQFADGGMLGSKPYAASGAYINRMSDYCQSCTYNVKTKTEENSCPFNALFWDFLHRNAIKLRGNPRLAQMYRTWERMNEETQIAYLNRARQVLEKVDQGEL